MHAHYMDRLILDMEIVQFGLNTMRRVQIYCRRSLPAFENPTLSAVREGQEALVQRGREVERGRRDAEGAKDVVLAMNIYSDQGCVSVGLWKETTHKYCSSDFPDRRSTMKPAQSVEKPYATEILQTQGSVNGCKWNMGGTYSPSRARISKAYQDTSPAGSDSGVR
jgi:hypothetical protein